VRGIALTQDAKIEGVMSELNITPAATTVQKSYVGGLSAEAGQSAVAVSNSTTSVQTAQNSAQAKAVEQRELSREETYAAVEVANKALESITKNNLLFEVDEATSQVVIKIVDASTKRVVGQFPTTEMLNFMKAMKELEEQGTTKNVGLFFSNQA